MAEPHSTQNLAKKPGKKRGPTKTSWKKGQSGNPGGRKKDVGHIQMLAREFTEAALATLVEVMENCQELGASRVRAAECVLDRGWGRPTSTVALTGEGGGPVQFQEAQNELSDIVARLVTRRTEDEVASEPH
jgi:hypothetical protein